MATGRHVGQCIGGCVRAWVVRYRLTPPLPLLVQVKGHRYFECGDGHGVLVGPTKVHAEGVLTKDGRLPPNAGGRICT